MSAARIAVPTYNDNLIDMPLAKLGFEEVDESINYRIVASTAAVEKCGKTHWALTAPGPIGAISTDTGTEEVAKRFLKDKRIVIRQFKSADELKEMGGQPGVRQARYEKEWSTMRDCMRAIIDNPKFRTMVIDTGTEAWELCRLAAFGKLSQVMPQHYVEVNAEFRAIVKAAYERKDLNVIWVHKMKKEYKTNSSGKDNWSGKYERSGFGDMPFLVDINIRQYYDKTNSTFGIEVMDSRINMLDVAGSQMEGPLCSFPMLAECLFPETRGQRFWQ